MARVVQMKVFGVLAWHKTKSMIWYSDAHAVSIYRMSVFGSGVRWRDAGGKIETNEIGRACGVYGGG